MSVVMSIPYEFSGAAISNIKEINSSFATGTLKVMYLGGNRNGSFFSKDSVNRALPSLKNVPIVCHWNDELGEIGGHDVAVVSDESGGLRIKNLTEPCGVVPDHAVFSFSKECDEYGVEHEYLVIDGVILWKRQDVFKHISEDLDGKVKHSMEISVNNSAKTDDGLVNILDFEFTALCLLESCEPCFQGSGLELYTSQYFKQRMELMMSELKQTLEGEQDTVTASFQEADDKHPHNQTEGGEKVLEERTALVEKYGFDVEALDFSIEDMTIEDLTAKLEAMKQDNTSADPNPEEGFALNSNITEEIIRELGTEKVQREWGEGTRYWYVDCDLDQKEVYCWDTMDWLLYGFSFSTNGDAVTIDYATKKRMKYTIVDFEGEQESPFASVFEQMASKIEESANWESKYQTASATIESLENEVTELRKFKLDIEEAQLNEKREELFNKFDKLAGIEEYDQLRDDCKECDLDALEEKLYAILGRNSTAVKFSNETKASKQVVDNGPDEKVGPYGDLFEKFGYSITD